MVKITESHCRKNGNSSNLVVENAVTVNGPEVEKADIEASNGIIHIVDDTIDPIPMINIAEIVFTDPR